MQLFLASILSCAAVLVGVLAQTDWKPYSSCGGGVASLSDEARLFSGTSPTLFDGNPIESLARGIDYDRGAEDTATEKVFERTRNASIRQKEVKPLTETSGLLARHKGPAFTFTDPIGRTVKMDFDLSEFSFEMLGEGLSKDKLKAKKFFSTVSAIAERELRKELARNARQERAERRDAKRELQDGLLRIDRLDHAEPIEAKREQANEYIRFERSDRTDRSNQ